MTEEQRLARLAEMSGNAAVHEEARWSRQSRAREADAAEAHADAAPAAGAAAETLKSESENNQPRGILRNPKVLENLPNSRWHRLPAADPSLQLLLTWARVAWRCAMHALLSLPQRSCRAQQGKRSTAWGQHVYNALAVLVSSGRGMRSCTQQPVSPAFLMRFHFELALVAAHFTRACSNVWPVCARAPQTTSGARARRASWRLPPRRCTARAGRPPAWRTASGAASTTPSAAAGRASGDEHAICWTELAFCWRFLLRCMLCSTHCFTEQCPGQGSLKVCNPAMLKIRVKYGGPVVLTVCVLQGFRVCPKALALAC